MKTSLKRGRIYQFQDYPQGGNHLYNRVRVSFSHSENRCLGCKMASKATRKVNSMSKNEKSQSYFQTATIKCFCGAEILMLPDLKLMASAIEKHVSWHKEKIKDKAQAELEAKRIRDFLNMQVLKKASETSA
jgi:hypothetical protein